MTTGNFVKVSLDDPNYDVANPENTDYAAEYAGVVAGELAGAGC